MLKTYGEMYELLKTPGSETLKYIGLRSESGILMDPRILAQQLIGDDKVCTIGQMDNQQVGSICPQLYSFVVGHSYFLATLANIAH